MTLPPEQMQKVYAIQQSMFEKFRNIPKEETISVPLEIIPVKNNTVNQTTTPPVTQPVQPTPVVKPAPVRPTRAS